MSDKQTIKVNFWIYTQNLGDGSCGNKFFRSEDSAEKYASYDDERMCDDINKYSLEFDLEGNLITPEPKISAWAQEAAEKRWAEELERRRERNSRYQKLYPNEKIYFTCPPDCKHSISNFDCKKGK